MCVSAFNYSEIIRTKSLKTFLKPERYLDEDFSKLKCFIQITIYDSITQIIY